MNPSQTTTRRSSNLKRDQRFQVLTLHNVGHGPKHISEQLGITRRQVQYTICRGYVSPQKRKGRPPKLTSEQVDELEAFVVASSTNRQMSYLELSMNFTQWNVGEGAIRGALARRGYARYRALNVLDSAKEKKDQKFQMETSKEKDKCDINHSDAQDSDNCVLIQNDIQS